MKKIFILISAVCAMAFVSCSNEEEIVNENKKEVIKASDIKFDIKVADLGCNSGTRAAKTGWVAGDKINIWIDDLDVMGLQGSYDKLEGRAELTLTYQDDGTWKPEFDEWYADHSQGLLHTLEGKTAGILNCLYEGSNDISKYSVDASDHDYTFTLPTKNDVPLTQLVCCAKVDYKYKDNTISATIDKWSMLTKIQVLVQGLTGDASNYTLSCYNMYNLSCIYINSESGDVYSDGDTESPTCGVSNEDGVAFCFSEVDEYRNGIPFEFTLSYGTDTWTYTTKEAKTVDTGDGEVLFIKLPSPFDTPSKWE